MWGPKAMSSKRLPPEERREHLLFGRAHFSAPPFDAVSMEDIARRAGVSKALLYHYFSGRRGFYVATVRHVVDDVLEAMGSTDGTLPALLDSFVAFSEANAGIYRTILRGALGADAEVEAETDRVRAFVLQKVEAVRQGPLDPLSRIALRGWMAFVEEAVAEWLEAPVERARFLEMLLRVLAAVH